MVSNATQKHFNFSWTDHPSTFPSSLYKFYQTQKYTDVELSCQEQKVKCHKLVLIASSPYFEEKILENQSGQPIVVPEGITLATTEQILEYMYRGHVNVEQNEMIEFLQAAKKLKVKGMLNENGNVGAPALAESGAGGKEQGRGEDFAKKRRLSIYRKYTKEDLAAAVQKVLVGVRPTVAARAHGVPVSTLYDKVAAARASNQPQTQENSAPSTKVNKLFATGFPLSVEKSSSTQASQNEGHDEPKERGNLPFSRFLPATKVAEDDDDIVFIEEVISNTNK